MTVTKPKGKEQVSVTVPYTTGYGPLPAAGGLYDQPYRLMEFWTIFLQTDRSVTLKSLS